MFILFPNIFEIKQYVTYLTNRSFAILKMNLHCFSAVLQLLSNETDNVWFSRILYKQFEMILV